MTGGATAVAAGSAMISDMILAPKPLLAATLALAVIVGATACGPQDPPSAREDQQRSTTTGVASRDDDDTAPPTSTQTASAGSGTTPDGTPSTDAGRLRTIFTFPGQPTVQWTEEALGTPDEGNNRVPGPTDFAYTAVLDYGDEATVADLVAGLSAAPNLLPEDRLEPWYPDAVADAVDGAGVVIDVYTGVPGFTVTQEVGVVRDAPRYILLFRATT